MTEQFAAKRGCWLPRLDEIEFFTRPRSIPELAAYLDVTPRFISAEISRGNLRSIQLSNNLVRLEPRDIRAWLDGKASTQRKETKKKELQEAAK
jgi:hypothetical protein